MRLASSIEESFEAPDAGLWEKRNEPARHSFSLLMHWMGARSLKAMGTALEDAELRECGQRLQTRAGRCLDEECWNEEGGFFAETVGGSQADASLLFMKYSINRK